MVMKEWCLLSMNDNVGQSMCWEISEIQSRMVFVEKKGSKSSGNGVSWSEVVSAKLVP